MSYQFECTRLRESNAAGDLQMSGLYWREDAAARTGWLFYAGCLLVFIFCLAAAGIVLWIALNLDSVILFIVGGIPFLGMSALTVIRTFEKPPERAITFHRDGTIRAPYGLPRHKKLRELRLRHDEISRIELGPDDSGRPQEWRRNVNIITQDGRTGPVGRHLHEEEARQVAVGLSLALKEMRETASESDRVSRPMTSAPAPQHPNPYDPGIID